MIQSEVYHPNKRIFLYICSLISSEKAIKQYILTMKNGIWLSDFETQSGRAGSVLAPLYCPLGGPSHVIGRKDSAFLDHVTS